MSFRNSVEGGRNDTSLFRFCCCLSSYRIDTVYWGAFGEKRQKKLWILKTGIITKGA